MFNDEKAYVYSIEQRVINRLIKEFGYIPEDCLEEEYEKEYKKLLKMRKQRKNG